MTKLDDASTRHLRASVILSFPGAGAGSESMGRGLGFGIGLGMTFGAHWGGITAGGSTGVTLVAHS